MTATVTAPPIVPDFEKGHFPDRKLAVICSKGSVDWAYPGLILANAALGEGIETHLFFTFHGLDMIIVPTMGELQFETVDETSTLRQSLTDVNAPEVPEFLELFVASGGHVWACQTSVAMNQLDAEQLYDGVERIINAAEFVEMTDGAKYIFI